MTLVLAERPKERGASSPSASPAPLSPVTMQLLLGQICLDNGKPAEAFSLFEVASRSGDPRALNMLGRAYERGWGVARNRRRPAPILRRPPPMGWMGHVQPRRPVSGWRGCASGHQKSLLSLYFRRTERCFKSFQHVGADCRKRESPELDPEKRRISFWPRPSPEIAGGIST